MTYTYKTFSGNKIEMVARAVYDALAEGNSDIDSAVRVVVGDKAARTMAAARRVFASYKRSPEKLERGIVESQRVETTKLIVKNLRQARERLKPTA